MVGNIRIFYAFARSGGTLLNQLLGVHPDCLVLSEVNPAASYKSITAQAIEWLELLGEQEANWFEGLGYSEKIAVLAERAEHKGKMLIVRDWPTVNFLHSTAGDTIDATQLMEQRLYLQRNDRPLTEIALTRRSYGVYNSMVKNFSQFKHLGEDEFAESYIRYAEAIKEFKIFHMEDLQQKPATIISEILSHLKIPPCDPANLVDSFSDFLKCTGDNTLEFASSRDAGRIVKPEHVQRSDGANDLLRQADRILGYE